MQVTMHQRVEGIYAGTSGQLGDLIQVTISGGQMLVEWKYQNYQPIAFKIANGETRKVDVVAVSYSYYVAPGHSELLVKYQDGMLLIDGNESTWDRANTDRAFCAFHHHRRCFVCFRGAA